MATFTSEPSSEGNTPRFAYEVVGPEIDSMTNLADDAYDQSVEFLERLLEFVAENQVSNVNVTLDDVDVDIPSLSIPPVPAAPTLNINLPNLPADFIPNTIAGIDLNSIGAIPTFTAADPIVNLPTAPTPFSGTAPGPAPTINDSFTFPTGRTRHSGEH